MLSKLLVINSNIHVSLSDTLDDVHILELSKRITSESDLMELGIKGLRLEKFLIEAALYRHPKDIQDAALDVLSEWMKQQRNMTDAYTTLLKCLDVHSNSSSQPLSSPVQAPSNAASPQSPQATTGIPIGTALIINSDIPLHSETSLIIS